MRLRKLAEREAMVRAVLAMEPEAMAADAAAELGIHRSTFIRIRLGQMWRDVLPELERLKLEQTVRDCTTCSLWEPLNAPESDPCSIGIPERKRQGSGWARICSAYKLRKAP